MTSASGSEGLLRKELQRTADALVDSGAETGLQIAVYRHGEPLAEIVAGTADPAADPAADPSADLAADPVADSEAGPGRPVTADMPFFAFSVGKGVTATLAHRLVEQGLFAYDTRVAEVWPEFAAHGKATVTVRQVLDHSAGVPHLPDHTTPGDLCDWDAMCAAIAGAEPLWEPGTAFGYHAYTFGFLIGEVIRRTTGRPISEVLREQITEPLGVADQLFYGVPPSAMPRLARLADAQPPAPDRPAPDLPALGPTAAFGNRPDLLAADIPACCTTSARAIARVYAATLGEVDGVRLLSPDTLRTATAVSISGVDQVHGVESAFGLGYAVSGDGGATPTTFGMGGGGGGTACGNTETGIAYALIKNRLTPNFTTADTIGRIITATTQSRQRHPKP